MVALRARLGTHECGNLNFRGRCSRVVFIFEALLELILGTTKLCLTLLLLIILHLLHELLTLNGLRDRHLGVRDGLIMDTTMVFKLGALRSRTPG